MGPGTTAGPLGGRSPPAVGSRAGRSLGRPSPSHQSLHPQPRGPPPILSPPSSRGPMRAAVRSPKRRHGSIARSAQFDGRGMVESRHSTPTGRVPPVGAPLWIFNLGSWTTDYRPLVTSPRGWGSGCGGEPRMGVPPRIPAVLLQEDHPRRPQDGSRSMVELRRTRRRPFPHEPAVFQSSWIRCFGASFVSA